MKIAPLTPVFAARIEDVDLTRPRATPFDSTRYHRWMQRTTVSGDPGEPAVR